MGEKRAIEIDAGLLRAIEEHLGELSAGSVEEYVEVVLRERLLSQGFLSPYTPEEEKEVEKRLRDLGYLD